MTQATAESIVCAYTRSVELVNTELPSSAKDTATDLYEALRDYLVLLLSDERKEVELLLSNPSKEVYA